MMKAYLVLCFWLIISLSTEAQKKVVVIGDLQGVEDGVCFDIIETDSRGGSMSPNLDPINGVVHNGRFILEHTCKSSSIRHFTLRTSAEGFLQGIELHLWINQGDTAYIVGKGKRFIDWKVKSDAQEQRELNAFQEACLPEWRQYIQILAEKEKYKEYRRNTEMSVEEWDKSKETLIGLEARVDSMWTLVQRSELEWMRTMPIGTVWMEKMSDIVYRHVMSPPHPLIDDIKSLYRLRSTEINRKPEAKEIMSGLYPYPKAALGNLIVDGELYDVDGKKYSLSDFRGKYVLVDFWARTCSHCIAALPEMKEFADAHSDSLNIVSISVDKDETWKIASATHKIPWYNLNDGCCMSGLASSYSVKALPTYLLISPEGVWLTMWEGYGKGVFNEKLKDWF